MYEYEYIDIDYNDREYENLSEQIENFKKEDISVSLWKEIFIQAKNDVYNILLLQNGYGYFSVPVEERDLYFISLETNTFHIFATKHVLRTMKIAEERIAEKEEESIEL